MSGNAPSYYEVVTPNNNTLWHLRSSIFNTQREQKLRPNWDGSGKMSGAGAAGVIWFLGLAWPCGFQSGALADIW